MILQLTDDDILGADAASKTNCPIARGLKRVLKRNDITVSTKFTDIGDEFICNTKEIQAFIRKFDYSRLVNSRTLDIPYEP